MKIPYSISTRVCAALAVLGVMSGAALAGDSDARSESAKSSTKSKVAASKTEAKTQRIEVTGSRIPREARRTNWTRDIELSVAIIDRKQLDRSGEATFTQALRKQPMFR